MDTIEHPKAIAMFEALRTTFHVPSADELLKYRTRTTLGGRVNVKLEMPSDDEGKGALANGNYPDFGDLYDYVDVYRLSEEQSDGLLELLRTRYPDAGYPENTSELKLRRGDICK